MQSFTISNAVLVSSDGLIKNAYVSVKNGKITEIGTNYTGSGAIDANGLYLSAGFVDIHLHGGGGSDFMDGAPAYENIANAHVKGGTTSIVATTVADSFDATRAAITGFLKAKRGKDLKVNLLGLHMEGPYFSPVHAGAQPPEYIKAFDYDEYNALTQMAEGSILRWSAAPELRGMEDFAKYMQDNDIRPSIAHSDADYHCVKRAFDAGFTTVTHLYSAMSGIKRVHGFRVAGIIESAYLIDKMDVEIIADGCHLPPELLRYVYKFKDKSRIALVTDSMRAGGQDVKESYLGSKSAGIRVIIEDGVAKMPDRTGFGGSIATADRLIRTMIKHSGASLVEAVKMMTENPVRMLGKNIKKGTVKEGYDADLVLFDSDINVKRVFRGGEPVYNRD